MTDIRMYCSEEYKKTVKTAAIQKGVSVSDLLYSIVKQAIPESDQSANLCIELEHINRTLATMGGKMTVEERQELKDRRTAIKQVIGRGEKENG